MKDESRYFLDDLLADWFKWSNAYQAVAAHGASAMFTGVRSSRQFDSENDVIDAGLHNGKMESIDFHINQLIPLHRTALGMQARNLSTGYQVWKSARLPDDVAQRAAILGEARGLLMARLIGAGVM